VIDRGLTHVALPVRDLDASVAFYATYAGMEVVHERKDPAHGTRVAWISDGTRPFVVVLIEVEEVRHPLLPLGHLGVGCASRDEVDRLAEAAHAEGRPVWGPTDSGPPVGYWALIGDPDQHTLELSHGQEVGLTVERAAAREGRG
jgi:catechol 2,3-dioxygenase-like lactoylglutathione lyase family enzyme